MNPVPPSSQPLPSTSDLCVSPELAVLAVLQSALRVTSQVLDIQNPLAGTLDALTPDPEESPSDNPNSNCMFPISHFRVGPSR